MPERAKQNSSCGVKPAVPSCLISLYIYNFTPDAWAIELGSMKITLVSQSPFSAFLYAVGMWFTVLLLMSVLGGWRRMAKRFPARGKPAGKLFPRQRGKVGKRYYCVNIHTAPEGIYLCVWWPFSFGHAPVLIPWDAIHNATARSFLWCKEIEFDLGAPRVATIRLPKRVFDGRGMGMVV